MLRSLASLASVGCTVAGDVLWDGRFNDMTSSAALNDWSFSNEVGPYQYYIHGAGPVTDYVNLNSSYKNPADTSSNQGAKITIDNTSYWNSDGMRRTELIPQTTAKINSGHVYYHFSMSRLDVNAPGSMEEHQVAFFESHFTELKYGLISGEQGVSSDANLRWDVGGSSQWNVVFEASVWHNIVYDIDFDAGTVGFWHSTGSDDLVQVVKPITASTSSNGADWHLGILRLADTTAAADDSPEDWYFSGVYIESGDLTTSVAGPGGDMGSAPVSSALSSSIISASSTEPIATSSYLVETSTSAFPTLTLDPIASSMAASYMPSGTGILVSSGSIVSSAIAATATISSKKKCSSMLSTGSAVAAIVTSLPVEEPAPLPTTPDTTVYITSTTTILETFTTSAKSITKQSSALPVTAIVNCQSAFTVTYTPTITVTLGAETALPTLVASVPTPSGFLTVTASSNFGPTILPTAPVGTDPGVGGTDSNTGLRSLIEEVLALVEKLLARQ
ncbi:hypothetical protein MMC25_007473 [Agyrium rufum]|nr:hypothetical protein [Agyrium rufum]